MLFYAERPGRVIRQVVSDVVALGWLGLWGYAAWYVNEQVLRLRTPGERLVVAGVEVRGGFSDAANRADRLPVVGDDLADALRRGSGAGDSLRGAGEAQIAAVEDLAVLLAVIVMVIPLMFLLATWLPMRLRFVLNARSIRQLRRIGADDLLALRALTRRPARRLVGFGTDPTAAWRRSDVKVIDQLACVELAAFGLRR